MLQLPIVLASASPRRLALLRELGLDPRPLPTGIPEDPLADETPRRHVERLAEAKAVRAVEMLHDERFDALVLAADTLVTLDGEILGKPVDDADAVRMLLRLAGRTHEVMTAVHAFRTDRGTSARAVEITRVRFRAYPETLAAWYARTGEPRDKAGAYGIQGLGVLLSDGLEGSWSNVVGLPLERLPGLFTDVGLDLFQRISDSRGRR